VQVWIGPRGYFLRESLQLLEQRLRKHGFIRAHRAALVRLDGVRELTRTRSGQVAVLGGWGANHDLQATECSIHDGSAASW